MAKRRTSPIRADATWKITRQWWWIVINLCQYDEGLISIGYVKPGVVDKGFYPEITKPTAAPTERKEL
jgi:hypothetical protein